jgi:Enoyl-CoA hydratase/isomerase
MGLETMTYERDGRIARVMLDRPERGNGITLEMPRELADCVERANLDPEVHVIALAGNGSGFCGGYDLVASAEQFEEGRVAADPAAPGAEEAAGIATGSPIDPATIAANHDPSSTWDPVVDFQMMSRNVRGFMSLFWPVPLAHAGGVDRLTRDRRSADDNLAAKRRPGPVGR